MNRLFLGDRAGTDQATDVVNFKFARAIAATFKDDDAVTAPPFEVHTFVLDGLWVG